MKKLKQLMALTAAVLALSLGGKAWAQPQGMDPQQLQNIIQQFQNMDPQQLENMRQMSQNMDPEERQAMREQFQNMDPQQQQDLLQQFSKMDPQQMQDAVQQRLNSSLREQMSVTNDADWSLIEVKIAAVKKARTALMAYGRGMIGMGGGFGGGRNGGLQAMSGQRSPELEALQQAVDSDTPAAQTRDLLAKFRAARKEKQVALAKAQDELRAVLTMRQQAVATLGRLLD